MLLNKDDYQKSVIKDVLKFKLYWLQSFVKIFYTVKFSSFFVNATIRYRCI